MISSTLLSADTVKFVIGKMIACSKLMGCALCRFISGVGEGGGSIRPAVMEAAAVGLAAPNPLFARQ